MVKDLAWVVEAHLLEGDGDNRYWRGPMQHMQAQLV